MPKKILLPLAVFIVTVIFFCLLSVLIPTDNSTQKFLLEIFGALNSVLLSLIATYIADPIIQSAAGFRHNLLNIFRIKKIRKLYHPLWIYFLGLLIAFGILFLVSLLNSSHYIMYIVDNSGSMGKCESYNQTTGQCQPRLNEDEYPINDVKRQLSKEFQDKNLGSNVVPTPTQNISGKRVATKIKTGLIEVGGEYKRGQSKCNAITHVIPRLNNQNELSNSLEKIDANDSGVTALVEGLKKAESAIGVDLRNPFNFSLSNNIIFFTDGDKDNCEENIDFCEAVKRDIPKDFNIRLNIFTQSPNCEQFKCSDYEDYSCKIVRNFSDEEVSQSIAQIKNKILSPNSNKFQSEVPSSNVNGIQSKRLLIPQIIDMIPNLIIGFSTVFILLAIVGNFSWFIKPIKALYLWSIKLVKSFLRAFILLSTKQVQVPLLLVVMPLLLLVIIIVAVIVLIFRVNIL